MLVGYGLVECSLIAEVAGLELAREQYLLASRLSLSYYSVLGLTGLILVALSRPTESIWPKMDCSARSQWRSNPVAAAGTSDKVESHHRLSRL